MPLALYTDAHVPRAITNGLRRRGVEVLTTQEDGKAELDDPSVKAESGVFRYGVFRQTEHRVIYKLVFYGGVDIYAIETPNDASGIMEYCTRSTEPDRSLE